MKFGRDFCNKGYRKIEDNIAVELVSCTIVNQSNQDLTNLLEGEFQYIFSDNGTELILKNNSETEITLRRVAQLGSTTVVNNTMPTNVSVQ